jgi:hypothetical protein
MKKAKDLSKVLFDSLGIKQTADLLGRKIEVSFFHKLDTYWYFIELCFVIQSCILEIDYNYSADICFPWISLEEDKEVRLIIIGSDDYLIQYRSPITIDKPTRSEIQEFMKSEKRNELSRGKYRLL